MKNIFAFLILFAGTSVFGADYTKEILEESKSINFEKVLEQIKKIPIGEGKGCKSEVRSIQQKERSLDNGVLVFASFSMPDIALKELSDESEKYGATIVIRGLYKGSFRETAKKILSISKEGLRLSINPELFKKHNVQKVPVFILMRDGEEFNRLSGNITLKYAMSKLNLI